MVKKTYFVTTAIDYPNAEPHIGHAYQKIIADVLSRYHRLQGEDVLFLTGTDEHGKKIQETAQKLNKSPKEFVDEQAKKFKFAWEKLQVNYDRFIRTTDPDHVKLVQDVIKKCEKNGDIYKGTYEGWYCVGCEAYYTQKDLVDGNCPIHNRPAEKLKEESYFFKLSKYENFLLHMYKKPDFIQPAERRNEIINRVKEGLKDLSISRTSFDWGIPFPLDKKHVTYVWFDALFNYLSGSGKNQKYWPANIHLLGKDNGWFHSVYWPAFLKSAGYPLPKTVFIHGFLTFNGQKISKSLGNSISPITLVDKYGSDSIRYFVCRNFVFKEDGDFDENALIERHNNELANKLGNLVSRVSALAEKYGLKKCPIKNLSSKSTVNKVDSHFEKYEFDKALNEIFAFIDKTNEFIQSKKPWETQDKNVLYEAANAIKDIAILLSPFMPSSSEKISKTFNFEISLKSLKLPLKISKISKSELLFNKIENKEKPQSIKISNNQSNNMENKISIEEFARVELKVGKILSAEDHPKADKLLVLTVDLNEDSPRTIVAGLKKHYKKEDLINKKAIFAVNLAPANLRGIESNGMILAAVSNDESKVIFLTPEKDIEQGSRIR